MHGLENNETPKFLLKNPTNYSHAIVVEEPEGGGFLVIPLLINEVTSYFKCQNPSHSEYEYGDLPRINFSAEDSDWDPSDQDYARRKEAMMEFSGAMVNEDTMKEGPNMVIKQVSLGTGVSDVSSDDNFGPALERKINVSNKFDASVARGINTTHKIM